MPGSLGSDRVDIVWEFRLRLEAIDFVNEALRVTRKQTHKRRRNQSIKSSQTKRSKPDLIKSVGIMLALLILGTTVLLLWKPRRPESEPASKPLTPKVEAPLISLKLEGLSAEAQTGLLRERAAQLGRRLVSTFPRTAEAHVLQGNTFRQLGQSAQALACWQKALALAPRRPDAYTYMAILAEEKGESAQALAHWEKVLDLEPDHAGVRDSLAHTLMTLNRRDEAIEFLQEELSLSPRSARTHYLLGKAHLREKRFPAAIEYFQKTLALDPNFIQAHYELATALVRSGRRQEAQLYRDQFQQRNKQQKKKDLYGFTAQDDLRKAKQSMANLATAAAGLYQATGQSLAGLALLEQAVRLDPENLEMRKTLAARYQAQGQLQEALGQCEQIADLEPKDVTCQMLIGSLSLQLGHDAQAESAFRRMVDLAPGQSYGYRELARLSLKTNKDPKQAQAWARQAVTLEPSAQNYYVLGLVCQRNGDTRSALQALLQALKKDSSNQAYQKAYRQITLGR